MIRARTALAALAPVLLHALAREADRGLGLVLRSEVEPRAPPRGRPRGAADGAGRVGARRPVARRRRRCVAPAWLAERAGAGWAEALAREAALFAPLSCAPAITLLALVSVAVRPSYPYGFTLPVALTQDWGIGQDARRARRAPRAAPARPCALPAPRARRGVPRWASSPTPCSRPTGRGAGRATRATSPSTCARRWPSATASRFDAEGVSAAMEELPDAAARARRSRRPSTALARESGAWRSPWPAARPAATRSARRASRARRSGARTAASTTCSRRGRRCCSRRRCALDRALNRARGEPGRVAVSVLAWCALAALLVAALFLLVRDATGRPGLAGVLAVRLRARAALPLLLLPVLPGDAGRARPGGRVPRACAPARGPAAAPVALRRAARDAAVAAPEVPAGLAGARGDGASVGGWWRSGPPRADVLAVASSVPQARDACT